MSINNLNRNILFKVLKVLFLSRNSMHTYIHIIFFIYDVYARIHTDIDNINTCIYTQIDRQ